MWDLGLGGAVWRVHCEMRSAWLGLGGGWVFADGSFRCRLWQDGVLPRGYCGRVVLDEVSKVSFLAVLRRVYLLSPGFASRNTLRKRGPGRRRMRRALVRWVLDIERPLFHDVVEL